MKADCHMHMLLDGGYWKTAIDRHREKPDIPWIRQTLALYRQKGYTYLRDGGDRWGVGAAARELAPEYGITYRTPLAPLCKAGHYGAFIGVAYSDMKEYVRLVKDHRKKGADFIKIMISGLMDFDHFGSLTESPLTPEEIRELIHIAHQEGFSVMAHANGGETVAAAAAAGVDSIEHGAYLDRRALEEMVKYGTVWVPTVSTVANLRGNGRFREEAVQNIYKSFRENILAFSAMGGLLAVGSDAGAWAVPHALGSEERLLQAVDTAGGTQRIREKF